MRRAREKIDPKIDFDDETIHLLIEAALTKTDKYKAEVLDALEMEYPQFKDQIDKYRVLL